MEIEIWKDIIGYEGLYQVSNFGNIISFKQGKRLLLKQEKVSGYLRIKLYDKSIGIKKVLTHRLVGVLFVPNPEKKPCINHLDGNKLNNHSSNIEWCTYSENNKHSYDLGLKVPSNLKLSKYDKLEIKRLFESGIKNKQLASIYNVNHCTISSITNNK